MFAPVFGDDAMPGLCAAVVANDGMGVVLARQEIDDLFFARIAKAEIDGQNCLFHDVVPI